jgi:uncharacterized protein (UPF0548 family)
MRPSALIGRVDIPSALAALETKRVNFGLGRPEDWAPERGWRIDDFTQPLPSEPPGQPAENGSWQIARRLARNYDFAEPSIVTAYFDPEHPLERRNMLLELRFYGLRLWVGVRVGDVYDEVRRIDGRSAHVWGWSYRTLEGHVEEGQMDWQVWKWLDDGTVEFRIHAVSRAAKRGNLLVRAGFRLVGRREQLRFLGQTCRRMARLTADALGVPTAEVPEGRAQTGPSLRPSDPSKGVRA